MRFGRIAIALQVFSVSSPLPASARGEPELRADSASAVHEVAAFQSERLDGRLRKPAPSFDLLVRRHHCGDDCSGRLRVLLGDKVNRAHRRTAVQWFSCHQHDLTICHGLSSRRRSGMIDYKANRSGRIELDRFLKAATAVFRKTLASEIVVDEKLSIRTVEFSRELP